MHTMKLDLLYVCHRPVFFPQGQIKPRQKRKADTEDEMWRSSSTCPSGLSLKSGKRSNLCLLSLIFFCCVLKLFSILYSTRLFALVPYHFFLPLRNASLSFLLNRLVFFHFFVLTRGLVIPHFSSSAT